MLRWWLNVVGGVSLSVWLLVLLGEAVPLEFASPDGQLRFRLAVAAVGWFWPLALGVELRRRVRPNGRRALLVGLAVLLTLLALGFCGLFAILSQMAYDEGWEDERVLWRRSGRPAARVVVQRQLDQSAQDNDQWRVVQLTPVLGLWQLVEPIDTARFDAAGW